ncbi:futalosine hydrolase [Desulfovibrionales bacterium]
MIILACATQRECSHALRRILPEASRLPAVVHHGRHSLRVACVGMGPVAAALRMGEVLTRFPQATGVLHLGICGTYDTSQADLGQICVATSETFPEYGVFTGDPEHQPPFTHAMLPELNLADPRHIALDPHNAAAHLGFSIPTEWPAGPSLTVSGVSGTLQRAQALARASAGLTENMEGFSIALAALAHGLPCVEIRTVSNVAGEQDKRYWNFSAAFHALETIVPTLLGDM